MTPRKILIAGATLLGVALSSCGKSDDIITTAQNSILAALKSQGIYERGNLGDPPPTSEQLKGYFDIVGGAYRWIVNEGAANRGDSSFEIQRGDSIAFRFDARMFSGNNFDQYSTFYTNIPARIEVVAGNNPDFEGWSTDLFKIKVGDDPRILKSLQEALISCRAGDGDPENDDAPGGVASDQVRVYLTPNLAFGNKIVYGVPANRTIVFEITDIEIIKN
jgi:hypothetical protein